MLKDLHLIQAAIDADGIIISRDDTVRMLFARAARVVGEMSQLRPRRHAGECRRRRDP